MVVKPDLFRNLWVMRAIHGTGRHSLNYDILILFATERKRSGETQAKIMKEKLKEQ